MSIEIAIPGWKNLCLETVLFDLNGTLACDGRIAASTRERLVALAKHVAIYVMSADTHGTLERETAGLPVHVRRVEPGLGAAQKVALLRELGVQSTVAVGNGHNDVEMLRAAALAIAILARRVRRCRRCSSLMWPSLPLTMPWRACSIHAAWWRLCAGEGELRIADLTQHGGG